MKLFNIASALSAALTLAASAANPFGVFDFDLRGNDSPAQIHHFEGITTRVQHPKDLVKFDAYHASVWLVLSGPKGAD
jgi:hypothetical protein